VIPPLLRDRVFRRYWSAATISMFGDQIGGLALPLAAVLALHATAAQMGYLTALEWLPSLLFGLFLGAWVDRRGKRRLTMICADLGRLVLFGVVPLCFALHALSMPLLYAIIFLAGTLSILFTVSDATMFVSIVPPEQYVDGQSLNYGSRALSFVGGPAVGGLLVQLVTAPVAVLADAVSFLGSALFLSRIRPAEPPAASADAGSVLAGARFVRHDRIVRSSLIAVAMVNFFNLMFNALYLLYGVRVLGIRAGTLGVLLGVAAVGGLLGAFCTKRLAGRIGIGWAYVLGCFLFTAPLLLWPLASGSRLMVLVLLFLAEFGCGFGLMVLDISIGAIFAAVIPNELRARVSGAFQAVNYGTRPLGALLGGVLATSMGLRPAMWIATAGGVAAACLLLPSPLPRFRMPLS
jgi:MFS family permease